MTFFYHLGRYLSMLWETIAKPEKFSMYLKETFRQMREIGVGSLGIISIMTLFIGAVTAVQFSYQLQGKLIPMFWIGIIVRDSLILELAPTLSCLLLAGKIGSNISSELGTMRISEQIDALKIMGINTAGYLVGPKIIASVLVIPLLLIFAVFFGILGGLLAGYASTIYSPTEFIRGLQDPLEDFNTVVMFIKGITFAFIITSVSCYQGYYATGGVVGVGQASTRAVVFSSIVLIIANFLIAALVL
jgi:phospholipid/cholesterol/gamma-HCH transport system permease protein